MGRYTSDFAKKNQNHLGNGGYVSMLKATGIGRGAVGTNRVKSIQQRMTYTFLQNLLELLVWAPSKNREPLAPDSSGMVNRTTKDSNHAGTQGNKSISSHSGYDEST